LIVESILAQLGGWIDDYNRQAPHSALGMRSPADYRALVSANSELTPPSV
jgi:transposase InsO family protein